jgi:demethylmenaquinone methyltransferase / 2-methoxy-6-polyprenyl-1,4-benzoquinol methylase
MSDRIRSIFTNVVKRYDIMNDILSLGMHRLWKRMLVKTACLKPNDHVLDLACGTGDISALVYPIIRQQGYLTGIDANDTMLNVAQTRFLKKGWWENVAWQCCTAEQHNTGSYHAILCAFGVRNFEDRALALQNGLKCLKPLGGLFLLEFSPMLEGWKKQLYQRYEAIIPTMGEWVTQHREAYQYLVDSIASFPKAPQFARMLQDMGFQAVGYRLLGGGLVACHWGFQVCNASKTHS